MDVNMVIFVLLKSVENNENRRTVRTVSTLTTRSIRMNRVGAAWKIRSGHSTKMSRLTVSTFPATSLQSRSTQPRVAGPKHRSRSGGKGLTLGHLTRVNRVELGVSRKLERHNQEPTGGTVRVLL